MKISKNNKSHTPVESTDVITNGYQAAVDHIQEAIESLGPHAKEDEIARDAIANLSVVLFELK